MEELQDAIEDAQYINAINTQEDGPRPVLPWEKPSEEQLLEWEEKVRKENKSGSTAFDMDWTLSSAIGLFLFSSFVKEKCDDYCRMNFCEDIIRLRTLRGRTRLDKARMIARDYLRPPIKDEDTGEFVLPKRTEIDEYDLERVIPKRRLNQEQVESLFKVNMDYPECTESIVGLKGPVLKDLFDKMKEMDNLDGLRKTESMPASILIKEKATSPDVVIPGDNNHHADDTKEFLVTRSFDEDEPINRHEEAVSGITNARQRLRHSGGRSATDIPEDVFDTAETVVMESLRRQYWEMFQGSEEYAKVKNFLWYQDRRVVPEDFFVMRVLGRGGFGLVTACKKGTSGKLYAMKVMNKRRIKMKKSEQLALNERQVLAAVESNFVVNLKYSFHSKDDVFLILDLMTGGDLGYHLHQKGRFPKKECQYYSARIMLGLQALHDKQYVYRDLKPENCLLADDGRVKITDLGLATRITPDLHGAAGTRGYWAPEMLRRDKKGRRMPYGHTVDWFSFGCCVAEFISGANPFRSEAALNFGLERGKQTKEKAIDCATMEMDPAFSPDKFDPDAADLCRRLLDKNEKTRLGFAGCEEIMAHPWFKNVNWESITSDRKRPPFLPPKDVNAASQSEIGTFAEDKAYQETTVTQSDEAFYEHWDWTNPRAFAAEVIEFLIYERETGVPLVPVTQHASCCCVIL